MYRCAHAVSLAFVLRLTHTYQTTLYLCRAAFAFFGTPYRNVAFGFSSTLRHGAHALFYASHLPLRYLHGRARSPPPVALTNARGRRSYRVHRWFTNRITASSVASTRLRAFLLFSRTPRTRIALFASFTFVPLGTSAGHWHFTPIIGLPGAPLRVSPLHAGRYRVCAGAPRHHLLPGLPFLFLGRARASAPNVSRLRTFGLNASYFTVSITRVTLPTARCMPRYLRRIDAAKFGYLTVA